ncbi:unnamed protein product [Withania somnifera]
MLIQSGFSWHPPSVDKSEFYSMPQCWMAMGDMMVCGYKISLILGGHLGDGSMNLDAIGDRCCKAINDVSSKCAFEGVNPLSLFIPPFVNDLCFGNKGDLFTPNNNDPFGPSENGPIENNPVSPRRLYRILPSRTHLFIPSYNIFP